VITTFMQISGEEFKEFRFIPIKINMLNSYDITKIIQNEGDIAWLKSDGANHIYINFSTSPKIYKFQLTPDFKLVGIFNKEGNGPGEMFAPVTFGLVNDTICVTGKDGIRLNIFSRNGKLLDYYLTSNSGGFTLFTHQGKVFGFLTIPAMYFNEENVPNSLYKFKMDGKTLIPEYSCCPIQPIGSYLANQMSDFLLSNDSLLFVSFKYIDRIVCYNLNNLSFKSFGSPAKMHLKSPFLGEHTTRKNKMIFRLTGNEYVCFRTIFKFSSHILGAFFWGKPPKSFSYLDILNGNIGGEIIHFFNLFTGAYLFSIKLPFRLYYLTYSPALDMWIGFKGNLYEIVTFKIKGI